MPRTESEQPLIIKPLEPLEREKGRKRTDSTSRMRVNPTPVRKVIRGLDTLLAPKEESEKRPISPRQPKPAETKVHQEVPPGGKVDINVNVASMDKRAFLRELGYGSLGVIMGVVGASLRNAFHRQKENLASPEEVQEIKEVASRTQEKYAETVRDYAGEVQEMNNQIIGLTAENTALKIRNQGKEIALKAMILAQGELLNNSLQSEKDQVILGLCGIAEGTISLISDANQILGEFLGGIDSMKKKARSLFIQVEDTLNVSDDLDDLINYGLETISSVVNWANTLTNKITEPLESAIDKLCDWSPRIASIRETVSKGVKFVEKDLPKKIEDKRKKKAVAKEELEKAKASWVEGPWGFPINPITGLAEKIHQWAEEKTESAFTQIRSNRNLVNERRALREASLFLLKPENMIELQEGMTKWCEEYYQLYQGFPDAKTMAEKTAEIQTYLLARARAEASNRVGGNGLGNPLAQ